MATQMVAGSRARLRWGIRRQDAERLAQKARTEGVRLRRDRLTGQFYATSVSDPASLHPVSLTGGCDCRGFRTTGRCKHVAALYAHFGIVH